MKKRFKSYLAASIVCLGLPMTMLGDPILGNAPVNGDAFSIAFEQGNTWGAAVAFTPQQDVSLLSVTLWLTGYDGQSGQSLSAGIWNDANQMDSFLSSKPAVDLAYLTTPAPNDGSLAAFTFTELSAPSVLQADTKYWLFVYGTGDFSGSYLSWAQGNNPTGNALYDGTDVFAEGTFTSASSLIPAFTINTIASNISPVPEPTTLGLAGMSCALLALYRYRK